MSINQEDLISMYNRAQALSNASKWVEALLEINEALAVDATDLDVVTMKAIILNELKQNTESIKLFKTILTRDPDNFVANYNIGVACVEDNNLDAAIESFEKCVNIDNESSNALFQYGNVLRSAGFLDKAENAYLQGLKTGERVDDLCCNLIVTLNQQRKFGEATKYWSEYAMTSLDADVAIAHGQSLLGLSDFTAAVTVFENAVILDPDSPLAWFCLGDARELLNLIPEAIEAFRHDLSIDSNNTDVAQRLEMIQYDQQESAV